MELGSYLNFPSKVNSQVFYNLLEMPVKKHNPSISMNEITHAHHSPPLLVLPKFKISSGKKYMTSRELSD